MTRFKAHPRLPGRRAAQILLTMGVVATTAIATAVPASATTKSISGTYPSSSISYYVRIDVSSTYVSAYADTSHYYSEATLAIEMCSGTGVCSTPPNTIAANRNYNTYYISTGNPSSFGHTYRACFSSRFGTTSYSHYCTPLTAA